MIHQLDNPVWSAMISGNQHLALGNEKARYFNRVVSPFVGIPQNSCECFEALHAIVPDNEPVALFTTENNLDASPWKIINRIDGYQMMYSKEAREWPEHNDVMPLNECHVPAMLTLTQMNPPGPFSAQTIQFGNYKGIFSGDLLVAMAGWRFHSDPYVEISAVCTHPDHTGKGYARELIMSQVKQLQEQGKKPYLHVRADNTRAISIYQDMGFETRTEMIIYILRKA